MTDITPCPHCRRTEFIYDGKCWNKNCPARGPVCAGKVIEAEELGTFFDVENPHFETS